jgi:hypothetical protein
MIGMIYSLTSAVSNGYALFEAILMAVLIPNVKRGHKGHEQNDLKNCHLSSPDSVSLVADGLRVTYCNDKCNPISACHPHFLAYL